MSNLSTKNKEQARFQHISCRSRYEESRIISAIIRKEVLPSSKTAVIITPLNDLKFFLCTALKDMHPEGSVPFLWTLGGRFFVLLAKVALGEEGLSDIFALLKHPFVKHGYPQIPILSEHLERIMRTTHITSFNDFGERVRFFKKKRRVIEHFLNDLRRYLSLVSGLRHETSFSIFFADLCAYAYDIIGPPNIDLGITEELKRRSLTMLSVKKLSGLIELLSSFLIPALPSDHRIRIIEPEVFSMAEVVILGGTESWDISPVIEAVGSSTLFITSGRHIPADTQISLWTKEIRSTQSNQAEIFPRPCPCPPVLERPRQASVTDLILWKNNPYAFYVKRILNISPLSMLDRPVHYGLSMHRFLAAFTQECSSSEEKAGREKIGRLKKRFFPEYSLNPFLDTHLDKALSWFCEKEAERRDAFCQTYVEHFGTMTLSIEEVSFEVRTRADRLDLFPGGNMSIVEYKTGGGGKRADHAFQLWLESEIALRGGFGHIPASISSREVWDLKNQKCFSFPLEASFSSQFSIWIDGFFQKTTPYAAHPLPADKHIALLSRIKEWRTLTTEISVDTKFDS